MRVRDELKMTIAAFQTLYRSSVEFGTKKLAYAEIGKAEQEARIKGLEAQRKVLTDKV